MSFVRNKAFYIVIISICIMIVTLRSYVFTIYRVTGNSMQATLQDGDKLFVLRNKNLARKSIIIFDNANGTFVKRCVGLPGDTVYLKNGIVFCNSKPLDFPPTVLISSLDSRHPMINVFYRRDWSVNNFGPIIVPRKGVTIPLDNLNRSLYEASIKLDSGINSITSLSQQKFYTFKHDCYFVLGDNRSYSQDSRFMGFIKEEDVVGTSNFILYSLANLTRSFTTFL